MLRPGRFDGIISNKNAAKLFPPNISQVNESQKSRKSTSLVKRHPLKPQNAQTFDQKDNVHMKTKQRKKEQE